MKNQPDNSTNAGRQDFFAQFSDDERKDIKKIWRKSRKLSPSKPEVNNPEIDKAWHNIDARIDDAVSSSKWRWMAAAAVILLIAGAGFMAMPQTITAPNGKFVTATLPDGSTVELNSGTQLTYNRLFGVTNRSVDLNGEAYFSIKRGEHPFLVQGAESTVRVTGTKFNVRSWNDEPGKITEVAVSEGEVQFYRDDLREKSVTITPGHASSLSKQMVQPSPPQKVQIDRIIGWRSHKLMFNNKSLMVIFNELERRFDVQIILDNARMTKQTLTAFYENPNDVESVLKDICRVKGLNYTETAKGYRVY